MITANITPPKLGDVKEYTRIERVPIFTTHVRKLTKPDSGEVLTTKVDADQLAIICENTNKRVRKGEYPLITIGHRDFKKPEKEQPPLVGYIGENVVGEYNGNPTILADLYVMNTQKDEFMTYPRRSAEVFSKESPEGYIDSVAVLRRVPALDLGYITHFEKEGIEIFECPECALERGNELADNDRDGVPDDEDIDDDNDGVDDPEDEDADGDGNNDQAVASLAKAIASQVATSLSTNQDFLKVVGSAAATHFASNDDALNAMIQRIGDVLDKKTSGDQKNKQGNNNMSDENTTNDNKQGENFSANEQALAVRLGAAEVKFEQLEVRHNSLLEKFEALVSKNEATEAENRKIKRRSRLEKIANDVDINVDEKLEKFSSLSDEQFEMFASELEETVRIPLNNKKIPTAHMDGKPKPLPSESVENFENELTPEEFSSNAVITYAKENNIDLTAEDGGIKAVREYLNNADRSKYGIKKK